MFGGLIRLLFLGFLFWLGWLLVRRIKALLEESRSSGGQHPQQVHMLRCEHCGLHIPEHEGVRALSGHVYCCETHRRLANQ